MNANIMKTQIFNKIQHALKSHGRSYKAILSKFFLVQSFI